MSTLDYRGNNDTVGEARNEWGVEHLDQDAYLSRIAYKGDLTPTAETLRRLHRAHAAAIPFENLDIVLGLGVSLETDAMQEKLLRHERGGYCFEHNLLFAALLERLGYRVRRLAARVQPGKPGPRTHMLLIVEADGTKWLADVGFGAALLEPVCFGDDAVSHQGGWTYGLQRGEDGVWLLRSSTSDGWSDLYGFRGIVKSCGSDSVSHAATFSSVPSTSSPFVNSAPALTSATR